MLRALIASFSFSLLLLLTACGGDGGAAAGKTSPPGASVISSVAVKGVIQNGVVKLLRWQGGGYQVVASTQTQADGSFSFPGFTPIAGEVLKLQLTAGSSSSMICDAASCGSAAFGAAVAMPANLVLSSWVSVDAEGAVTVMPITPVSTLLVGYAEALGGGRLKASVLTVARSHVATLFRLDADELMAQPGNIANTPWIGAASEAQLKMTLLAAGFAQLAGGDASKMNSVIQNYTQSFIDNNGRLMELDPAGTQTLAELFHAVNTAVALITLKEVKDTALAWAQDIITVLRNGEMSSVCRGELCSPEFDTQRFVDALGPMGDDLEAVLAGSKYDSLEQMVAGEINKFGWLASDDGVDLAAAAVQTIAYSAEAMLTRMQLEFIAAFFNMPLDSFETEPVNLDSVNELNATLNGNVLTVTGKEGGLDVNLTVTLPALLTTMKGDKQFAFGLEGTVSNERVSGEVNASLLIDAEDTDFDPLLVTLNPAVISEALQAVQDDDVSNDDAASAAFKNVLNAMADLAKNAEFTVHIEAEKFRFAKKAEGDLPESLLAMEGKGAVHVDMDGGVLSNHRIALEGAVEYGRITLPNGSWFEVGEGDHLSFAMDEDGSFDAKFSTMVLTLFTGEAEGRLANMGVTISNLRDSIVSQIKTETLDLKGMLSQLLTDVSSMDLLVTADMRLVELDHLYKLRLANTDLTVSQPDSDATAMTVSLSFNGVLVAAGDAWWMFAPDLRDLERPAILISDDQGWAWRYAFDFSELVADL